MRVQSARKDNHFSNTIDKKCPKNLIFGHLFLFIKEIIPKSETSALLFCSFFSLVGSNKLGLDISRNELVAGELHDEAGSALGKA